MNFQYKTLLSLDSLTKFLNQGERIIAIRKMLDQEAEITPKISEALMIISYHNWKPPKQKYGQDRLLYYQTITGSWLLFDKYNHPIINEIKKLT